MQIVDQSAQIAARADERALGAQRDIQRVEEALSDRIDDLSKVVAKGFEDVLAEIVALKVENAKRAGAERLLRWLLTLAVTVALGLAGIFYTGHHAPTSHH